jgi:hypothetical protein
MKVTKIINNSRVYFITYCIISTHNTSRLTKQDWDLIQSTTKYLHSEMNREGYYMAPGHSIRTHIEPVLDAPEKGKYVIQCLGDAEK